MLSRKHNNNNACCRQKNKSCNHTAIGELPDKRQQWAEQGKRFNHRSEKQNSFSAFVSCYQAGRQAQDQSEQEPSIVTHFVQPVLYQRASEQQDVGGATCILVHDALVWFSVSVHM